MTKPTFQDQFRSARRASAPLIAVRTADPWSAMGQIQKVLGPDYDKTPVMVWDMIRSLQGFNTAGQRAVSELLANLDPSALGNLPAFLDKLREIRVQDCIVGILGSRVAWDDPASVQAIWNLRDIFKGVGNMLVMFAGLGAKLPGELVDDVLVLDEPLPTRDELNEILDGILKSAEIEKVPDDDRTSWVDAVAGLAAFPAETAFAMAVSKTNKTMDRDMLWARKVQTIEQQPGLTVFKGEIDQPVGLENMRAYLTSIMNGRKKYRAILFLDEVEKAFAGTGTDLSGTKTGMTGTWCTWCTETETDGVLFLGVPGGGKTLVAKWASSIVGVPTIMMDFAGMQSGIIGSTEERLRRALATVVGIAQGPVLVIGTCNSIGQMPPEVLRRFNRGKFFFDLMTEKERKACWNFYGKKFSIPSNDPLPRDDDWTGSEIKECSEMAFQLNVPLAEAANYIVPVMRSDGEKIKAVRQFASGKYISASKPGTYSWTENQEAPQFLGTTGRKLGV